MSCLSIFSTAELTYDLVYGDRLQAAPQNRAAAWSRDEGKSLALDLKERERAAAAAAAEQHDARA